MQDLAGKRVLLIITGGIAAYKSLELIRMIRKNGGSVRAILTRGGQQFITPLSVASLSGDVCYTDLFSLKDEAEMGHIRLSREADLVVVAPASADLIAKMAHGMADDLATTALLATDKPVMIAPAMNVRMWQHPATQANIATLQSRGVTVIGPEDGEMACGEYGPGRMSEPDVILHAIHGAFDQAGRDAPLAGLRALVTSGPTYEPIDPVRFIGNRSSGKQGHAIACALRDAGADVTLVTGPVALPDPDGINTIRVETAVEMLEACHAALPVDIAVCAAAVSDWSAAAALSQKIKKRDNRNPPDLKLKENPDILATLARPSPKRPALVIGFAAETDRLIDEAKAKLASKNCDWIIANDVAAAPVFGADDNHVFLVRPDGYEEWPRTTKVDVARTLAARIADHFKTIHQQNQAAE